MFIKKIMLSSAAAAIAVSSAFAVNVPVGYSVYSYEDLKIGDRAGMNGGVIGCKSNVLVGFDAVVSTDIIAKGNVVLNDRASVDGAVTAGGAVVRGAGAVIKNGFAQYASVPVYTIPTKTFSTGTAIKTINNDATGSAAPGNYNKIEVLDRGTLTLSSGTYNCYSFKIGNDVKINFPTGPVIINVKSEFTFGDRSKMILPSGSDGSNIEIYYDGTTSVTIGFDSYAYGVFTAPYAAVTVADRAKFNGSLFAKKVELQPGLYATNLVDRWLSVDTDGDGVPDYVENACGTNPNGSGDKPAKIVSGTYANKTSQGAQTVRMSVSHVSGYSHVANFPISFGKNTVKGDLIPVNNLIATNDYRAPSIPLPIPSNFSLNGNKYHAVTGELQAGKKLLYGFPISDVSVGATKDFFRLSHFNEQVNAWEDVQIEYVTANAVYAYVSSFSVYAVKDYWSSPNVLKVDPTGSGTNIYSTFDAAIVYLNSVTDHANQDWIICIKGGANPSPVVYNWSGVIPFRTSIIGGFQTITGTGITDPNAAIVSNPKKYRTIFDAMNGGTRVIDGQPFFDLEQLNVQVPNANVIIDGLEFRNSNCPLGAVQLRASLSGGHYKNFILRNCVFEKNAGSSAGALYLINVEPVTIESCVFALNSCGNSATVSGSAVYISQASNCGAAASIRSCVFYGNTSTATFSTATGTICNAYNAGSVSAQRPVDVFDCTFYLNSSTMATGSSIFLQEPTIMPMSVNNCIIWDVGAPGAEALEPSTIPNNGIEETNTAFAGYSATPAIGFFDETKSASDAANVAVAIGPDNQWGTGDDGLRLKLGSSLRKVVAVASTATLFSTRDVAGRLRKSGVAPDLQSKGAYESYVRILTIGTENTLSQVDGFNYQSQLKTLAKTDGYLVDFVGTTRSNLKYEASCMTALGEDPSNPNNLTLLGNTTGITDLDMDTKVYDNVAGTTGKISEFAVPAYATALKNLEFDFALVNVGDDDILSSVTGSTALSSMLSFANSLVKTDRNRKILVSSLVQIADNTDPIYSQINTFNSDLLTDALGTYTGSDKSVIVKVNGTIKNDMNESLVSGISMESQLDVLNRIGTLNQNGFLIMAKIWWRTISAICPTM
jgi:hypothetical protein